MKSYLLNNLVSLDILINTLIGGRNRETLSGRMGRKIEAGDCRFCFFICRKIFHRLDPDHCKDTHTREKRYYE